MTEHIKPTNPTRPIPRPDAEPPPPLPPPPHPNDPPAGRHIGGSFQRMGWSREIRAWFLTIAGIVAIVLFLVFQSRQTEMQARILEIELRHDERAERSQKRYDAQADAHDHRVEASAQTHGQLGGVGQDLKQATTDLREVMQIIERERKARKQWKR